MNSIKYVVLTAALLSMICLSVAYNTHNYHWANNPTVQIRSEVPDDWTTEVVYASNHWNNALSNFNYLMTKSDSQNYITVGSVDGDGDIIAQSKVSTLSDLNPTTIDSGHVTFDQTEPFSTGDGAGTFNVEAIATHELGHMLGMAHSDINRTGFANDPTMIASEPPWGEEPLRTLENDDEQGARSIY